MNKFMKIAIDEAKKAIDESCGGPFGAIIVKDGKVVAKGHNKVISHIDPTCHGEIDAIRKACKKLGTHDLKGCEIYTTAYPCPMCFGAILWANIDKVFFGCNTSDTASIGFRDKQFEEELSQNKLDICNEIDKEECLKLFHEYAKKTTKATY